MPTGADWDDGDFTYDGAVNAGDLQALFFNYNLGTSTLTALQPAMTDSLAKQAAMSHLASNVATPSVAPIRFAAATTALNSSSISWAKWTTVGNSPFASDDKNVLSILLDDDDAAGL
jgi:hypothetical protein